MKHRLLSLLMALLMLPAFAAAEVMDDSALMLLQAAAAASYAPDGQIVSFLEGETVSPDFAARFLLAAGQDDLIDAEDRRAYLTGVLAAPLPEWEDVDVSLAPVGLEILSYDADEDGDAMMVIGEMTLTDEQGQASSLGMMMAAEMQRAEASPFGWQLHRFAPADDALLEAVAASFYGKAMAEYVNTAGGYAILYPDVFPEDSFVDEENGVSACLEAEGISFFVHKEANEEKLTMDDLLAAQKKENPALETNMDEMTGCARTRCLTEEGLVEVNLYLVSETAIYHAQFVCPEQAEAGFAPSLTYMMNSFTADELGLG